MKPNNTNKRAHAAIVALRHAGHAVYFHKRHWVLVDGAPVHVRRVAKLAAASAMILAVIACSPQQQAAVSTAIGDVQQACVSVQPVLAAATLSGNKTAASIAGYGNAVCGPLMQSGVVAPSVNASTPVWLGSLAGMIQTLLPLAVGLL